MSTCPPVNCAQWGDLQANSDIAGIGVMVAFMASAYLTLCLVIIYYLLEGQSTANPVDKVVVKGGARIWKSLFKSYPTLSEQWLNAIEDAILAFSDQQLVTGIGMLVSGYTQLHCSLSLYHWQIVVYLAWFSSLTHLTTLTALRKVFNQQRTLAYWRVVLMGCLIVLLATALIPTGYVSLQPPLDSSVSNDTMLLSVPAQCLYSWTGYEDAKQRLQDNGFDPAQGTNGLEPMNVALIFIAIWYMMISYLSRVFGMLGNPDSTALRSSRSHYGGYLKRLIVRLMQCSEDASWRLSRTAFNLCAGFFMTCYILLKIMFDIGQSMFWEIFWLIVGLAWGTLRLLTTWTDAHPEDETLWSFGQVLAVLLLALPFFSLAENIFKKVPVSQLRGRAGTQMTNPGPLLTPRITTKSQAQKEVLAKFEGLDLENEYWYRDLGLLTFAMAVATAADILYNFPAATIVQPVNAGDVTITPTGISSITQSWKQPLVQYIIWLALIFLVLFFYAAVFVAFGPDPWQRAFELVFSRGKRLGELGKGIARCTLLLYLWMGIVAFDICLFYASDSLSLAYYRATAWGR